MIYARLLLRELKKYLSQTGKVSVIISRNAESVWRLELDEDYTPYPDFNSYSIDDFMSPPASGSGDYSSMVICPCTMGTLGRIAAGTSDNLLIRAADVMLKEKRRLILVPRESPYNLIHITNMKTLAEAGAIILPASPSFYSKPGNPEEIAMTITERILTLLGIDCDPYHWGI